MKKVLLIALVVIGAGFASAQSKMAHLNSTEIMEAMPSYKDAVNKLQTFEKEGYEELQAMKTDFDKAVQAYQADVQSGNLTPVLQQSREQRLAKKEQDLMERQQSLQTEMQAYSQELNKPILETVEKAVEIVSEREGYEYVFDRTTLMIANGPDITEAVITEIMRIESESATTPE
ncbi:MAG: OmpH family outer membrane protein [Crocinitomicaceae bacterium]|nr:OmpH family outer membrane protein [Crocinitomicaceae bacterium]